jgi:hypothetical protein
MRHANACPGPRAKPAAPISRRELLWRSGGGLGGIALAAMLGADSLLAAPSPSTLGRHFPPKAKRVIQLFMNGGASQCDTFDYKPELIKRHGQTFDPGPGVVVEAATSQPGTVLKSPWDWRQHGQCGRWVSSVFPHVATCVDDLAFLMAMQTPTSEHSSAVLRQVSGFLMPGFPCLGSWVSYGLGRLSENLPAFVVLPDPRGLPYNAKGAFSPGFLPVSTSPTIIKAGAPQPIEDLFPPKDAKYVTREGDAAGLALLEQLNRRHLSRTPGDSRLDARIASYEMAARMQLSAPEVMDLAGETEPTKRLYGFDEPRTEPFGRNCLIARRMLERGVRFVQVWSGMDGATGNWDNHGNVKDDLAFIAGMVDRPIAGLLRDLKSRGMLDDTLVIWTTEFGRHPFAQAGTGRDHNGNAFCTWLAGAGVKGGTSYGATDEWSWKAAVDVTTAHDLHATVLRLLGIDHERLTFYNNGVDRRLTDVHGHVIRRILA